MKKYNDYLTESEDPNRITIGGIDYKVELIRGNPKVGRKFKTDNDIIQFLKNKKSLTFCLFDNRDKLFGIIPNINITQLSYEFISELKNNDAYLTVCTSSMSKDAIYPEFNISFRTMHLDIWDAYNSR